MLASQSALPPELPDRDSARRIDRSDPNDQRHLWMAAAIAALVLVLIVAATLISVIAPGQHQKDLAANEMASDVDHEGIAHEEHHKKQGDSEIAVEESLGDSKAGSSSEGLEVVTENELAESSPEAIPDTKANASRQHAESKSSQADQEIAGKFTDQKVDEAFVILLPNARMLDGSRPQANSSTFKSPLSQRSAESRMENLESYGGTEESELAVAAALDWLARHQLPSGAWSFDHSPSCDGSCPNRSLIVNAQQDPQVLANAATGLSLLPFLGAGFTHRDGKYKDVVRKGIRYLLKSQQNEVAGSRKGSWMEFAGFMYSHGIASMAICEAYAMTEDPELRSAAQAGVHFIAAAQHTPGGGWRYQPGDPGDMSMLGWQLMALKSGEIGGLAVNRQCFRGAEFFIDSLRVPRSGVYGYSAPMADNDDACTTAIGALGLYYLGRENESSEQQASVKFLIEKGPVLDDLYGLYYSTQAVMHLGGDDWPTWNLAVREHLIQSQKTAGHARGSWFTAGQGSHRTGELGGRTYCTAMSAMILEVYYRHLPLYAKKKP
jgi:hypothetical protein